jgi:hypothetical protein
MASFASDRNRDGTGLPASGANGRGFIARPRLRREIANATIGWVARLERRLRAPEPAGSLASPAGAARHMLNLLAFREELREHNLHDTSQKGRVRGGPHGGRRDPRVLCARTVDGSFNDLAQPGMGAAGARFGRNFPVQLTRPEPEPALLEPSPRTISRRLLARDGFKPAPTLNLLAAAWLQFQAHDWFSHGAPRPGDELSIPLEDSDEWFENPMRIRRTPPDPTRSAADAGQPPTFVNELSHW